MPYRRTRCTGWMNRMLLCAVQPQGQRRSVSIELSPERQKGRPTHPSQRRGGCCTITEEREVSWSRQHPGRTGPSRRRGRNHRSHDNLQRDLADRRMANPEDLVLGHHTSQESLQQCHNFRTISLISRSSKVTFKIILNRFKLQAEKIDAEERAGFRAGRSTTKQIFNLTVLCEKYV